jgi:hypothetical protein
MTYLLTLPAPASKSEGLIFKMLGAVKVTNYGPPPDIDIVIASPSASKVAGRVYVFEVPAGVV